MRTSSLILAVSFTLFGASMVEPINGNLPGPGTFAYNGSAVPSPAPEIVVSGLTLAKRS